MKRVLFKAMVCFLIAFILITTPNVISFANYLVDEIVNVGVVIQISSEKETVKSGEIHKVSVKNSYANPNDKDYATCRI